MVCMMKLERDARMAVAKYYWPGALGQLTLLHGCLYMAVNMEWGTLISKPPSRFKFLMPLLEITKYVP